MKKGQKKALLGVLLSSIIGPSAYYYAMNSGWGIHHPLIIYIVLGIWGSIIIGALSLLYLLFSPFVSKNDRIN